MMVYAYIAMTFTFGIFGLKVYGWSGYAILVLLYIYLKLGTIKITPPDWLSSSISISFSIRALPLRRDLKPCAI